MNLNRRRFLKQTGLAAGSLVLAGVNMACAVSGAPVRQVEISGSLIRFDTAVPELTKPGDAVALDSMLLEFPVLLIRRDDGRFTALSSQCTHLGCTVRKEPTLLRCPCHDSAFDLSGAVVNGPAARPLKEYPVRMNGSVAEIEVSW